jgi:hypothetical protein
VRTTDGLRKAAKESKGYGNATGPLAKSEPICAKRSPWSGRRCILKPGHSGAHSPGYANPSPAFPNDPDWTEEESV